MLKHNALVPRNSARCHGIAEFATAHNRGKSWCRWEGGLPLAFGETGSPVGTSRGTQGPRGGSEVPGGPPGRPSTSGIKGPAGEGVPRQAAQPPLTR